MNLVSACQRSKAACMRSQLARVPPTALDVQIAISNAGETIQPVSDETCVSSTGAANNQTGPTTVGTDVSVFTQMGSHNPQQFHPPD